MYIYIKYITKNILYFERCNNTKAKEIFLNILEIGMLKEIDFIIIL